MSSLALFSPPHIPGLLADSLSRFWPKWLSLVLNFRWLGWDALYRQTLIDNLRLASKATVVSDLSDLAEHNTAPPTLAELALWRHPELYLSL